MKKFDILYADINFQNEEIVSIYWGVKKIGFGELVISAIDHTILDSESMSDEFCQEIIDFVFKK